jgi:hypothetical protein
MVPGAIRRFPFEPSRIGQKDSTEWPAWWWTGTASLARTNRLPFRRGTERRRGKQVSFLSPVAVTAETCDGQRRLRDMLPTVAKNASQRKLT